MLQLLVREVCCISGFHRFIVSLGGLRLEEDRRVQMQIKGIISCIVTYSKALNL